MWAASYTLQVLVCLGYSQRSIFSTLLIVVDSLSFSKTFRFASFSGDIEKKIILYLCL